MNFMKYRTVAAAIGLAALLSACGGGGGGGDCLYGTACGEQPGTPETATISQLRLTLNAATVNNGDLPDVVATVTALTSTNTAVSGAEVEYSVQDQSTAVADTGAFIESAVVPTGTDGRTSATVNLGTDKSNRVITITAKAGGLTASKTINVRGTKISATPNALVDALAADTIVFQVKDSNDAAIPSVPIVIEANGVGTISATTDSNGLYTYNYTVPNIPGGTVVFNVSAAGTSQQYFVNVRAPLQVLPPPNLTGVTPVLQVNPNVVAVNATGSTANRAQVVARFENQSGNPIPNVRVSFRLEGANASTVLGAFSAGGDVITGTQVQTSDANGAVQTFYIPSTRSSPNNAISIRACYGATEAEAENCSAGTMSKPITIADEAVSVSIGTDGLLIDEAASLSYAQQFVIKVVNSAGQPKAGLTVSAQINTVDFFKGYYRRGSDEWYRDDGTTQTFLRCAKEDLDDDDRLDTTPVNEDRDFDGRLEPVRADVSLTPVNGWVTNAEGLVVVKMSYPKNVATWMSINLQATSLVGGSEGRASRQQILKALIDDIKDEAEPAFVESPYGRILNNVTLGANRLMPNNVTTLPAGTVLTPCINPD